MITLYRPTKKDILEVNKTIKEFGSYALSCQSDDSLVAYFANNTLNMFPNEDLGRTYTQFDLLKKNVENGKLVPIEVNTTIDKVFEVCWTFNECWTKNKEVKTDCEGLTTHPIGIGDIINDDGVWYIKLSVGYMKLN